MKYDNILQTIGDTPIVRLNRIGPSHVDMFVKVESFNPMASVRIVWLMPSSRTRGTAAR
ncbi:MAG: hypothetical protein CM15mP68_6120 [Pseudomonadota bacterium]|nr:MAG: hypothetical protein CM15mP68_6120 [Pseudomonadota bacterium]